TTIKRREDVEAASGVPLLGLGPLINPAQLAALEMEVDRAVFAYSMPRSPMAECLRTVRTNLLFRAEKGPIRRLLITSASPREGKSFISVNLAAIIATAGSRVLVIDADLRRPMVHKSFGLSNSVGLVDVLLGDIDLDGAIQHSHVPGVHVLTAGPIPTNPSEMLGVEAVRGLLDRSTDYDIILIDSPPVNVVSDALVLASLVDGVMFVVQASRTSRQLVSNCCSKLQEVNQNLLGTVVNKLNIQQDGYDYYYYYNDYYSYYSSAEERETRREMTAVK
ncbi:MAG: CpsD/CapB family tyrosine-protein kinase, partial [Proteobacteria bacterium]|nr:CpsD/CapB family tyrosine-protein kinase [Pseudomonadota bacterium]